MSFQFLKTETRANRNLMSLLKANIIGTPGKSLTYQHLQVEEKLEQIKEPYFFYIERNTNIVGTCCFCKRETNFKNQNINFYYLRYLTFSEKFRRSSHNINRSRSDSSLKKEVNEVLNGKGLNKSGNDKFYHYAYVDKANARSRLLTELFGFEPVRKFNTILFNRIINKNHPDIYEAKEEEVISLIENFYAGYNMFSKENLFGKRKFYIIKNSENKIVAGTSVNPDSWKIISMPGWFGKILLPVFSSIPYLNRMLNKDFKFLTLDGIFCMPGQEKYLEKLIEGLLFKYNLYTAMAWADTNSSVNQLFEKINLGLPAQITKSPEAEVICRFINFNEEERERFKNHPAYISGIDVT